MFYFSRYSLPKKISGHILLAGPTVGLKYFMRPLRAMKEKFVLVFLSEQPPQFRFWEEESELKSIYYIQGSPLDLTDLQRAGVERASRVIILANKMKSLVSM